MPQLRPLRAARARQRRRRARRSETWPAARGRRLHGQARQDRRHQSAHGSRTAARARPDRPRGLTIRHAPRDQCTLPGRPPAGLPATLGTRPITPPASKTVALQLSPRSERLSAGPRVTASDDLRARCPAWRDDRNRLAEPPHPGARLPSPLDVACPLPGGDQTAREPAGRDADHQPADDQCAALDRPLRGSLRRRSRLARASEQAERDCRARPRTTWKRPFGGSRRRARRAGRVGRTGAGAAGARGWPAAPRRHTRTPADAL
jgi:hypothetical protein